MMITFRQEKLAKEALVNFLQHALLFLSGSADRLLEGSNNTLLIDDQRLTLQVLSSELRDSFDAELAENQVWEIHPSDLESAGLFGSRLLIKTRAIRYWEQRYAENTREGSLYLFCLIEATDALLHKLVTACCIDETPLRISRLLLNLSDSTTAETMHGINQHVFPTDIAPYTVVTST